MIRIEKLSKTFRRQWALKDVTLQFSNNGVVALAGPNGSGKTTLIKSILGLVQPHSGQIFFKEAAIGRSVRYRELIGYMPQMGRYPDNMKVGQLFSMMRALRKDAPVTDERLYHDFNLQAISGKSMRTLSGGTRQKVSAALAFLFNPPVLILDEPTAGLDPLSSEILKDKIMEEKKKGKLVLVTSHVLSDLEDLATDVVYLYEGRLITHATVAELQEVTGEQKLNRIIARLMQDSMRSAPGKEIRAEGPPGDHSKKPML